MNEKYIRNRTAAVIIQDGKILLVQHHKYGKKYWLLPGGGVDYGETLFEATRREVKEETDLDVKIEDLLCISESIPPDGHRHVINYYFQAELSGGELHLGDDPYLCDVQWHRIEDLPHLIVYPNITQELIQWIQTGEIRPLSLGNRWD